jgi:hypothetical protein
MLDEQMGQPIVGCQSGDCSEAVKTRATEALGPLRTGDCP